MYYNIHSGVTKIKSSWGKYTAGFSAVAVVATFALTGMGASAAVSNNYSLFGDAAIVSGGNPGNTAQIGNEGPGYGGVDYGGTGITTFSQLNQLSTDYKFTQGTCGLGTPRFGATLSDGTNTGNVFFYIGPAPNYTACPPNEWMNTGNLAASTNLVDTSQLPLGTPYDVYSAAQTKYGAYTVTDLYVVADNGFPAVQKILLDNTRINTTTYTYDQSPTKDSCKNGGYQSMTNANGKSFKNQGDCVSYVATHGKNQASGSRTTF
jgi:hypothetical protein